MGFKRKGPSKKSSDNHLGEDETTVLSDMEDHIGPLGGEKQKKNNLMRHEQSDTHPNKTKL
eukprot:CAMPEP_0170562048 /NCGR_PEP_ID=MMETSP0211-20121228/58451_1 /TAXON_ID=311385 /ORGANISM="Pseudokeronopsis sp., Strain OXSARD2" /LENGTH=60 /DNA_ID=CAMNT_0010878407 /DNA_START=398 /DNA_END=580 /DNA_ORIENTATION=-